ncbi:MAG TPA: dienelactone hydrolase family protein [Microvirga sp.]|jgi:carboxymethylenebutenolidase
MTLSRRSVLAALAAGLAPQTALGQLQGGSYPSGGAAITIERFGASGGVRRPAVILLHGSDGPGQRYRGAAQQLASAGYHVFLPHYLERTGQSRAAFGTIGANLPAWSEAVRDAISYASGQPGVDPGRIGVLGISLGGGLGLRLAQQDRRVRALVSYFGFVPAGFTAAGRLPPTLVLHGAEDRVVSVQNATALQGILQARRIPHEVQIYPGEGHGFSVGAAADAAQRIAAFFGRTLR